MNLKKLNLKNLIKNYLYDARTYLSSPESELKYPSSPSARQQMNIDLQLPPENASESHFMLVSKIPLVLMKYTQNGSLSKCKTVCKSSTIQGDFNKMDL